MLAVPSKLVLLPIVLAVINFADCATLTALSGTIAAVPSKVVLLPIIRAVVSFRARSAAMVVSVVACTGPITRKES